MNFSRSSTIPFLGVFLIGILGSTAPCQLTTNLGAIGFLTKESTNSKKLLQNTLWYTLGKLTIFLFYGILIILFKFNIQSSSIHLFSLFRKLMGPSIVIIGFYILGVFNLKGSIGNSLIANVENFTHKFRIFNSSFIMGLIFSLAFCPTLFWLFFGIIVPLSFKSYLGIIYPPIFALGTLMPMMLMLLLIFIGKINLKLNIKRYKKIQKIIRLFGGLLLIILGLIDSLIYWFN
ncbi:MULTISPECIES: sulfite exporter TauE/SafE family protein [unclassified Clostridium]|uniref:urease accessory protein UreH domain-containing protein n=1 Tax=unclassified Clostridium TaxID=2614128 RepID=UPI0002975073|nr:MULTISPECIES: sulfite exporter TauE/SafE family protein [unclassified Clostridium]EKQ51888.1 MAG: cytochrome c biogenesis protein [Clostridium sp. Maddingley MBC34-26]